MTGIIIGALVGAYVSGGIGVAIALYQDAETWRHYALMVICTLAWPLYFLALWAFVHTYHRGLR